MVSQNIFLWTFYFSSVSSLLNLLPTPITTTATVAALTQVADQDCDSNCVPELCSSKVSQDCVHGTQLDTCSCCPVCLRHLNEICGGPQDSAGLCITGLNCLKSQNSSNDSHGICSPQTQECETTQCVEYNVTCPPDSYKLPQVSQFDGCCPPPPRCSCLPERCETQTCGPGMVRKLKVKGDGLPGSCCSVFECVETPQDCIHEGVKYRTGESWKADNCTTCVCQGGLKLCQRVKCDLGTCNRHQSSSDFNCCPPCENDCRSRGVIHKNLESWAEDDCTNCHCTNGTINCVATLCEPPKCSNPKRVPGQCCPVCRECSLICPHGFKKDPLGQPICECASQQSVAQPCQPDVICHKQCPQGFTRSPTGCELCECKDCKTVEKSCNKTCKHGYQKDQNGCKLCQCRIVTALINQFHHNQNSVCIFGGTAYTEGQTWNDECRQCICRSGKEMCEALSCFLNATKNEVTLSSSDNCSGACTNLTLLQKNGSHTQKASYADYYCSAHSIAPNSLWKFDNCLNCTCVNKKPFCQTQVCPPAPCRFPVRPGGSCCPYCIDSDLADNVFTQKRKYCVWNGKTYFNGQTWRGSWCESCICYEGQPKCFKEQCSTNYKSCQHIYHIKNRCCPLCFDSKSSLEECTYNGTIYKNGQTWDVKPCWSCVCLYGQSVCSEKSCSGKDCDHLSQEPGACCPHCMSDGGYSDGASSSQLLTLVVVFSLLTILIIIIVISVLIYVVTQPNQFHISSLSWPSTSSTTTTIDYREQDRLNISYSKIADCDKPLANV